MGCYTLESAEIEWWPKPIWKEAASEYKLHITLFSFTLLDIVINRIMLNEAIKNFIANYDKAFNNWISFHGASIQRRTGQTLGLNLLAKMNILPNSFIIQEDSRKLFNEMLANNPPIKEMPWYLVIPVTSKNFLDFNAWIKHYFNECWVEVSKDRYVGSLKFRDQVKLKNTEKIVHITPLPHITLGKITKIKHSNIFFEIIDKINEDFINHYSKSFPLSLDQLQFIDGPIMKTRKEITIINKTLMLYIPWHQETAIAIQGLVADLPKLEQRAIENMRLQLHIIASQLASLKSRKDSIFSTK